MAASARSKPTQVSKQKKTPTKRSRGSKGKKDSDFDSDGLDSDALDDSEPEESPKKRKQKSSPAKNTPRPRKKRKTRNADASDEDSELELKPGQKIVGTVVQAPKTGRVPAGQISQNTLEFLTQLTDPACNDRTWFKQHEPIFRQAEKEWKDFIDEFIPLLVEVDPQIPVLPAKDLVYRIYNDVRFKTDKTPYKTYFCATTSRSGRKGHFAGYHILLRPGNRTSFAAGAWQPEKQDLDNIRLAIQRSSRRLRAILSNPEFVVEFGDAQRHPDGLRQSIFGMGDELKVAPKGIKKDHEEIDLLKCRTFAVERSFTDVEVLSPDFKKELARVARIAMPLVHCLNDMMTLPGDDDDDDADDHDEEVDENGEDPQDEEDE